MIWVLMLMIMGVCQEVNASLLHHDNQVYSFCESQKNSFISVVWPLAQGKESKIEELFKQYGTIHYKKEVYLSKSQGILLLKAAHPHVADMDKHMKAYFPPGSLKNPARIYVLTFPGGYKSAFECKHAIRRLFKLGYQSIHINDYHYETMILAQFLFNGQFKRSYGVHQVIRNMRTTMMIYQAIFGMRLS